MIVPPVAHRREIDRNLGEFFRNHRAPRFNRAISLMCRYFNVRRPRIEWYEYIDWGKTAGRTFEDGRIHLVHPENWKRGRVYNSERMWVQMVYHELAHYLFWTDAESKAETFTHRMVRGLRRAPKRARVARTKGPKVQRASGSRGNGAIRAAAGCTRQDRGNARAAISSARSGGRSRRRKAITRTN